MFNGGAGQDSISSIAGQSAITATGGTGLDACVTNTNGSANDSVDGGDQDDLIVVGNSCAHCSRTLEELDLSPVVMVLTPSLLWALHLLVPSLVVLLMTASTSELVLATFGRELVPSVVPVLMPSTSLTGLVLALVMSKTSHRVSQTSLMRLVTSLNWTSRLAVLPFLPGRFWLATTTRLLASLCQQRSALACSDGTDTTSFNNASGVAVSHTFRSQVLT